MPSLPDRVLILNSTAPDAAEKERELNDLLATGYRIAEQRELAAGTLWLRLTTEPTVATGAHAPVPAPRPASPSATPDPPTRPAMRRALLVVFAVSLVKALFVFVADAADMIDGNGADTSIATEALVAIAAAVAWRRLSSESDEDTDIDPLRHLTSWRVLLGVLVLQVAFFMFVMVILSDSGDQAMLVLLGLVCGGLFQAYRVWQQLRDVSGNAQGSV